MLCGRRLRHKDQKKGENMSVSDKLIHVVNGDLDIYLILIAIVLGKT